MAELHPDTIFALLDAPALTTVSIGALRYCKDASQTARPWRQCGTTQGIGSQLLWKRWQQQQQAQREKGTI